MLDEVPLTVRLLKACLPYASLPNNGRVQLTLRNCAKDIGISGAAVSQAINGLRFDLKVENWFVDKTHLTLEQVQYVTRIVAVFDRVEKMLKAALSPNSYGVSHLLNPLRHRAGLPLVEMHGYERPGSEAMRSLIAVLEENCEEIEAGDPSQKNPT